MTDLALAIGHHALVFSLVAVLAVEFALAQDGLTGPALQRLGRIDALYGALAGAVILVGIARVLFGVRGWEYYVYYPVFWLKMAAFAVVGGLSAIPTTRIANWRRKAAADAGFSVDGAEITRLRRILKAEAVGIFFILAFAAAMARGVGY